MDLGFKFVVSCGKAVILVGDNLGTTVSNVLQTSIDQKFVCSILCCWGLHIFHVTSLMEGTYI